MESSYFDRQVFERDFYKLLKYSDGRHIAKEIKKSESYVSKMFNPSEPTQLALFRAAAVLAGWMATSPVRGKLALKKFNSYVELALADGQNESPEAIIQRKLVEVADDIKDVAALLDADVSETRWLGKLLVQRRKEKSNV